jgi:hypothetical protein
MPGTAAAFDTHPHYRTPCSNAQLTSALGKRTARQVADLYPDGMTLADLVLEQAIDADSITILDGAWGPHPMPIAVAADFGFRLTDLVISNGVTRGLMDEETARQTYVTKDRDFSEWSFLCTAESLRMHHRNRVFVLSETPEAFGLQNLWEIGYSLGDMNLGTGPEAFDRRTTAADAAQMVTAPFTAEQVVHLSAWQSGDSPLRCNTPECALTDAPVLKAAAEGLTCPQCGKLRSWAWQAMVGEAGQ